MKTCPKCKTRLPKEASFCGKCGKRLGEDIYAKPGIRVLGFLLDNITVQLFLVGVFYIISVFNPQFKFTDLMGYSEEFNTISWIGLITSIGVFSTYYTVMLATKGATFGKMWTKQKVVSMDNKQIGFKEAIIREIVSWVSMLALGIGYLWILRDNKRQAWHDKAAKTIVIKVSE